MKRILFPALMVTLLVACNSADTGKVSTGTDTANTAKREYAYTIDHPGDNWTPGDLAHVETVLKSLKAFENGDIATCIQGFVIA